MIYNAKGVAFRAIPFGFVEDCVLKPYKRSKGGKSDANCNRPWQ